MHRQIAVFASLLLMILHLAGCTPAPSSTSTNPPRQAAVAPEPAMTTADASHETATFGAGCFWGVEAKFRKIPGVTGTAVGYCGGGTSNPSYKEVCTDTTGHAEVVQVTFDPKVVSYQQLLDAFFSLHDPTQVNRQGPDFGKQYRTVVFVHSPQQRAAAEATIMRLDASGKYPRPIATKVEPEAPFWRAEEYHQRYLEKNGLDNCHI